MSLPAHRRTPALLACLATAVLLVGCGSESDPAPSSGGGGGGTPTTVPSADVTVVTLRFTDSSVAPEYHRSYELTVDGAEVHVVVDSYGDVIADQTEPTPPDLWADFVEGLPAALDDLPEPGADDGCTGGTVTALEVEVDGEVIFDETDGSCAGTGFQGDAQELLAPFAEVVDLDSLREA